MTPATASRVGCFSQARIAADDFGYVVAIIVRCSPSRR